MYTLYLLFVLNNKFVVVKQVGYKSEIACKQAVNKTDYDANDVIDYICLQTK